VVHGLGDCVYKTSCSVACREKHFSLRDNPCFVDYLNLHPHLCATFGEIGDFCAVDLALHCNEPVYIGPIQSDETRFTAATLITSFKDVQLVVELGISEGVPEAALEQPPCQLGNNNLHAHGGSQLYAVPIGHRGQQDYQGILVLESEGSEGTILHTSTATDHAEHIVPQTFSLIQFDAWDATTVYGVVTGSCFGSLHSITSEHDPVVSLCRYSTVTGLVQMVYSWGSEKEVEYVTSAFDPFEKLYFVITYDEVLDIEYIEAVNVLDGTLSNQMSIDVEGDIELLYFDHQKRQLFSSLLSNGTCTINLVDVTNATAVPVAQYLLDADQHFSMLTVFQLGTDEIPNRYLSLLYESTWEQHEIVRMEILSTPSQSASSSEYVQFADVIGPAATSLLVMDVETPLRHRRKQCHGKHCTFQSGARSLEHTSAPAITFVGTYDRLTYVNESIDVEIQISDINTPVVQLVVHVEVSNDELVRENDVMETGSTSDRLLTIYPVPAAVGFCRITVFVTDEQTEEVTKQSFLLFVGIEGCLYGDPRQGCEYANRELEPNRNSYIYGVESTRTAGETLDYRVQSRNQFNLDLYKAPKHLVSTCVLPWYRDADCSTIFHVDCIAAPGHGRDDIESGALNITSDVVYLQDGVYMVTTEILKKSGMYTVFTHSFRGEQIVSSPFRVLVGPARLHAPACDYFGPSISTAMEGGPSDVDNRLFIRARDRFYNERPAGDDFFGFKLLATLDRHAEAGAPVMGGSVSPVAGFAQEIPNESTGSVGAVYELIFWINGPVYMQQLQVCARNESNAFEVGACTDDFNMIFGLSVFVLPRIFYAENGAGQFETDTSFVFIDSVCPNGTEYGDVNRNLSAHLYDPGRGWQTPGPERARWEGAKGWINDGNASAASPNISSAFIQDCKEVGAGVDYFFYIQGVDEFGQLVHNNDEYAFKTIRAVSLGEDNTETVGNVEYAGDGVYMVSIQFQLGGWQPVVISALGSMFLDSPYYVKVVPGVLSAKGSFVDGVGTIMATEGIRERLPEGNKYYIHARDLYGNTRHDPTDAFAMDPMENEKYFAAEMEYVGDGTHKVTFWWDAAFVQNYQVCLRHHPNDPVGGYGACIWERAGGAGDPLHQYDRFESVYCEGQNQLGEQFSEGDIESCAITCLEDNKCISFEYAKGGTGRCTFSSTCGVPCPGRTQTNTNGNLEDVNCIPTPKTIYDTYVKYDAEVATLKEVASVYVYMRVNQGSKYTSPAHTKPLCLNNIFDDYACHIYTGTSGELSSFTIEARNELEFPNYRGGDVFHVNIEGPWNGPNRTVKTIEVQYLRIQYYLVEYVPTISGTYVIDIRLDSEQHGMGRPIGKSPYQALVQPDVPSPPHSYFTFPATFQVGDMNGIQIFVRDQFNNLCHPDEDHLLQVFTHTEYGTEISFPAMPASNHSNGEFRTQATLQHAGDYEISVQIWTRRKVFPYDFIHSHVIGSPDTVSLSAAPCSPSHTFVVGLSETGEISVGTDNFFEFQAKDAYGNSINETGMDFQIALEAQGDAPPILIDEIWEAENSANYGHFGFKHYGGLYYASYTATSIGIYFVSVRCQLASGTGFEELYYSPFSVRMTSGPAAKVVAAGPGMVGGEAGVVSEFNVRLYDRFNNDRDKADNTVVEFRRLGSTDVSLRVSVEDENLLNLVDIEDKEDNIAIYEGEYVLLVACTMQLIVLVEGTELQRVNSNFGILTESQGSFQISYGKPDRGSAVFDAENVGSGVVLGKAGGLLSFSTQLLDAYGNPRLIDDAIVQIGLQAMTMTGNMEDIQAQYVGIEYESLGVYRVTVQMNIAKMYTLWVRTASSNPPDDLPEGEEWEQEYVTIVESDLNSDASGISLMVSAAEAVPQMCQTRFSLLETSDIEAELTVELYDLFGNKNTYESWLGPDINVVMQGPVTITGVVEWVESRNLYLATYIPIVAGAYRLEITLRGSPVSNGDVQVQWGPVDPTTTTASGMGIIRTEPGTQAEVTFSVRDSSGNMVKDDVSTRFAINFAPDVDAMLSGGGIKPGPNYAEGAEYVITDDTGGEIYEDNDGKQITDGVTKAERASGTEASVGIRGVDPEVTIDMNEIVSFEKVRIYVGGGINEQGGIAGPVSAQVWVNADTTGLFTLWGEQPSLLDEEGWIEIEAISTVETAYRFVRVNLVRRTVWTTIGEIEVLAKYGICNLDYNAQGEGTGSVLLSYQLEYDPLSGYPGDSFCGNYPIEFTKIRYRLFVTFDDAPISGSPYMIRVGVYEPPSHKPYMVDALNNESPITEELNVVAGIVMPLQFQNVYLDGFPGCENDQCMVRVNDLSAEQNDQQGAPTYGSDFDLEAVSRGDGSLLTGPFSSAVAYPGEGLYRVTFAIVLVGEYSVTIKSISSGNAIGGMPMNVTVTSDVARPLSTIIEGANQPTVVDSDSTFKVYPYDQYGNKREEADVINLVWQSGTVGSAQIGEFVHGTDHQECSYTVTYIVQTCDQTASFYVTINGVETSAAPWIVPCVAGPIGYKTEVIGRSRAASLGDAVMTSGQTESLLFRARDRHGNQKSTGGEAHTFSVEIVEPVIPNPTPVAAAPVATFLDVGDGTYRVSYTVRFSGTHVINIAIDDVLIQGSPLYSIVGPGDLLPGNSFATVPDEAEVGVDFLVQITQRDANGNLIESETAGVTYIISVGPSIFTNPESPLMVYSSYTVTGPTDVLVQMRDPSGSVFIIDSRRQGRYTISLMPGLAVPENSIVVEGVQKTIDCVANVDNVMVIQTRDQFENDCYEPMDPSRGAFNLYLTACEPSDAACPTSSTATIPGTVAYTEDGKYKLTFAVTEVGYHTLFVRFETTNVLLAPYVILSDTGVRTTQRSCLLLPYIHCFANLYTPANVWKLHLRYLRLI
jgi:hypothetical protein